MNPALIVLIVIAVVLVVAFIVLTILGKKAQKRKEEQDEQIAAASQTVNMLIIDKKRMKLKDAGLPQQIPKLMRRSKLPVVKAKVGPRVMSLIADEQIFDEIPLKKEVKASVSGIYITAVRGIRGPLEKPKKKKGFRARMAENYSKANEQLKAEEAAKAERKAAKEAAKKAKKK